ncbi:MAG TPA: DUF3800 domain-containing protein [Burkholderiaceae bacterium]|nr:DUF3800 domain-containing protein [Burkholderiaceae bacterium]
MVSPSSYLANEPDAITTWFVDEAGDPTLFAKRGKPVVGEEGCSRFFIMGKLECRDVRALAADLVRLRADLLADPYFKNVPSMEPKRQRTALCFHAKDDPIEVRFLVFKLLARHELRFVAVVRDKLRLLDYAKQRRGIDPAYRYDANGHELYDELARRLFSRMHGYGDHRVVFAQRGHKPRTKAFMDAIAHEDNALDLAAGRKRLAPVEVVCGQPRGHAGLQAVDYYLWALQRFYERAEPRFLDFIWPQTIEVIDVDAAQVHMRGKLPGEFVIFNKEHPLTLQSRAGVRNADREI